MPQLSEHLVAMRTEHLEQAEPTLTRTPTLTPTLTLTLTCARGGGEERGGYLRDLDVGDRLAVAREGGGALLGGGGDRVAQPREPLG